MDLQLSAVDGVTIYGPPPEKRGSALAAFNVEGVHATDLSTFLDFEGRPPALMPDLAVGEFHPQQGRLPSMLNAFVPSPWVACYEAGGKARASSVHVHMCRDCGAVRAPLHTAAAPLPGHQRLSQSVALHIQHHGAPVMYDQRCGTRLMVMS